VKVAHAWINIILVAAGGICNSYTCLVAAWFGVVAHYVLIFRNVSLTLDGKMGHVYVTFCCAYSLVQVHR
jgi:hypothetical protein